MDKFVDVCKPVMTRRGRPYREPKIDPDGKVVLVDGSAKRQDQVLPTDEIEFEDVPVGRLMVMALDRADDKLTAEERRKRFVLSTKIEEAIEDQEALKISSEDRKRIEAAADLITTNHMFLYRIHEALELATPAEEKPRVKVKANGIEAANQA